MQFRRADGEVVQASQWFRHGDHPAVRPASSADAPFSASPEKLGWLDGAGGGQLVLPGDWVVSTSGARLVVREQSFRKGYTPLGEQLQTP